MILDLKLLKTLCKKQSLYSTPELNDKLFCHMQGLTVLGPDLRLYTGVKALYLNGNALMRLENLDTMSELRCLYVQDNGLGSLEGVPQCVREINASNNQLGELGALPPQLTSLLVANNRFRSPDDVRAALLACPELSVLDLSNNRIEDPALLDVLVAMPSLRVLYLKGNDVVNKIPQYRKTLVSRIPNLSYLDDRPVFPEERRLAEAWARDGREGEERERVAMRDEKAAKEERNHLAFRRMVEDGRKRAGYEGGQATIEGADSDSDAVSVEGDDEETAATKKAATAAADDDDDEVKEDAPEPKIVEVVEGAEGAPPALEEVKPVFVTEGAVDAAAPATRAVPAPGTDLLTELD